MGNDKGGAPAHEALQRLLDQSLRFRVQRGGRLVQDEDAWVAQDGARDGQALLLTPREFHAALADLRIVAILLLDDEVVRIRCLRRFKQLLVCGLRSAIAQVVADRAREEERLLKDDPDLAAQRVKGHVPQIIPVDQDPALGGVVEARDEVTQSALARATRADQGDHLAWLHIQTNPLEDQLIGVIAEGDILHDDVPLHRGQGHGIRLLGNGRLRVEHLEDALQRNRGALDDVVHLHHAHDRSVQLREVGGELNQAASGHSRLFPDRQVAAVAEDDRGAQARDELGRGAQRRAELYHVELHRGFLADIANETPLLRALTGEGLHHLGAGDPLGDASDDVGELLLDILARAADPGAQDEERPGIEREHQDGVERQLGAHREENHDEDDDGEGIADQLDEGAGKELVNVLNVPHHARQDLARLVLLVV